MFSRKLREIILGSPVLVLSGCACFNHGNCYQVSSCIIGKSLKGISYVPRTASEIYSFVSDNIYDLGDKIENLIPLHKEKHEFPYKFEMKKTPEVAPPPPIDKF